MHKPQLIQANMNYEKGEISKENFVSTLKKISLNLEESVKCLESEFEGTKEAHQCQLAIRSLKEVKELLFFSDFL